MEMVKSGFLRRREVAVRHFDRYSPDARRALSQAREVALRLNHKTICTEHLLCGLLEANDPVVSAVLSTLGVNVVRLHQALEFVIGKGNRTFQSEPALSIAARCDRRCARIGEELIDGPGAWGIARHRCFRARGRHLRALSPPGRCFYHATINRVGKPDGPRRSHAVARAAQGGAP